jgi:hypothetical protein
LFLMVSTFLSQDTVIRSAEENANIKIHAGPENSDLFITTKMK